MKPRIFGILSGGSGTRLWPLSRTSFPKQFQDLSGKGMPLLIATVRRIQALGIPMIITSQSMVDATRTNLQRNAHHDIALVIEPEGKNTAAAIALITSRALKENADATIGIFPADHHIEQTEEFQRIVEHAYTIAEHNACIVTIGIKPTYPATEYGYMSLNEQQEDQSFLVKQFLEKPDAQKAQTLVKEGCVWNAGMFVFTAKTMAELFAKHLPEVWEPIHNAESEEALAIAYKQVPDISIDYGIMEKTDAIRCLVADITWTDLGSWEAVMETRTDTEPAMQIEGGGNGYLQMSPTEKRAFFVGLEDVFVVDTPDALLVMKKGDGQKLRSVVNALKEKNDYLVHEHTFEERPWGRFEILLDTPHYKSKRLIMLPGKKLSYQQHKYRTENWIILKGIASVLIDGKEFLAHPGDHIVIHPGTKHRMGNEHNEPLEWLEAQTGSYFGEDDIERFEDDFGREGTAPEASVKAKEQQGKRI